MESVGLLYSNSLQMYGLRVDQHNLLMPSVKVAQFDSCTFHFNGPRKPSVVSSAWQNNSFTSLPFVHNPSQKLINENGVLRDKPVVDVSSVGKTIKEYTDDGLFEDAIRVYVNMLEYGSSIKEFRFFPCLIKAFGGLCDIEKARQIHGHVLKLGFSCDVYVQNSILGMYWTCAGVDDALQLFKKMSERDLVSWNTMMSGFCRSADYLASLMIFRRMIDEHGLYPNRVSCLSALTSSASTDYLIYGREIHGFLVKSGLDVQEFLVSGLIDMYMKCADIRSAQSVFKNIFDKETVRGNVVIWNVMITGYVNNECFSLAWELFIEMLNLGIRPDSSTMMTVFDLCSRSSDLEVGKQIHGLVFSHGLQNEVRIETAVIDMYFKCGDPEAGLKTFGQSQNHSLVMWGSVISSCAQNGCSAKALELLHKFMWEYGFPDSFILLASLRACKSLAIKCKGMEIHALVIKLTFDSDLFVGGALVDLYGKCGDMESAQKAFSGLPFRDLVSWNALITGYSQNECGDEALKALHDMQSEQIRPNTVTIATILSVCTQLSVMNLCKEVHCHLIRQGLEPNVLVSNSLIATYAKCGDIKSSLTVFQKMTKRDEVSWNSIIFGLGMHGHTDEMFLLFDKMTAQGKKPDHATFTALLSACSHAGRVDMGWKFFKSMVENCRLEPQVEQYTCMVDLLGRAGHLYEAYHLIKAMPCDQDERIWGSLLGSCKTHGDKKLAELVADHVFNLAPTSTGYRVLLANLYEDFGITDEYIRVRSDIKDMGLKKQPGCSWIEVNNNIHVFVADDHTHHQSDEIYSTIDCLTLEMKREGYIPVLQPVVVPVEKTGLPLGEEDGLLSPEVTLQ